MLRDRYGMTVAGYDELLAAQRGRCAVCGTTDPGGHWSRFHIDHDHRCGQIRGLLCNRCNGGLGYFFDDPELLRSAADYLERTAVR
jgi:hypothetical protein